MAAPPPPPPSQPEPELPPLALQPPPAAGAGDLGLLREMSDALLPALLDAIPARVMLLDGDECVRYANPAFFAFTGLHPKQVLGRPIVQVIGARAHAAYAPVRDGLARGETVCWEGWTVLAGVGRRYMREHLVPLRSAGGGVRGTLAISLDWTALKEREAELQARLQELQATEALKSSIVDHALAALVSTDAEGCIVEFNPAAEAMFGHARDAVLGRPVAEVIIPPRHRAAHAAGMARIAAGGAPRVLRRRVEMEALRADGDEFPVEMVLWRTTVGGRAFYTASLSDLTERRDAAAQIERQREALRQSEKLSAMGSLLAGVAHELNNPLAIVMGRASLLAEKTADSALAADARRISDAAERCGRIVRTFLNMARSKPAQRAPVALNALVTAAADMLQYGLRSHGITLELALAEPLPEVLGDADRIGQVVLNLLVNAQQALSSHDGPRRVVVSSGVEPPAMPGGAADARRGATRTPRVWLRVADSGRGVPPALRERIFEPFFTTKPEGLGTGLGLAVSRALAREHGGELQLEAGADGAAGACFRLSLPLGGAPAAPLAVEAAAAPVASRAARVLVVDDEPEILDLMREMLESDGHEVLAAESGAVALALLDETAVDAVVSDLRMPDIDGAALWRALGARAPALARRMLFVTGDTLSPAAHAFLADTGCACLDKPFARQDLLTRVRSLLDG